MNPTGRLQGDDLLLTRTFRAPIDDVWASVTESERTARWYGPWRGEPGAGRTIEVQMIQEEGGPWMEMTIEACEPPRRLALSSGGGWHLELELSHAAGVTELVFTQHRIKPEEVGDIGPGWEFYLDALVAAREGRPLPSFDDYYPAMKDHYEAQRP
jgi:uncharacterized protein YndB with AHSA1/START domain